MGPQGSRLEQLTQITQIVTDLKKQAAKLGANAIVIREVKIFEDIVGVD